MKKLDAPDGGPAFPVRSNIVGISQGMSLRQWYEGMALQGLLVRGETVSDAAQMAKVAADCMLRDEETSR